MIEQYPFISLILPISNESAFIERGLRAILEQDYSGEMEILIADGMFSELARYFLCAWA